MGARESNKKPKRGVVTSREKLDAAMAAAGIKSQTALAELIRDNENLDNPPRDTVSRAFRQIAIDTLSVGRIARALKVDAYTLYLSTQEHNSAIADDAPPQPPASFKWIILLLLLLSSLILFTFRYQTKTTPNITDEQQPILGQYSLIVHPYSTDTEALAQEMTQQLQQDFTVIKSNKTLLDKLAMSSDIANQYQADGVITLRRTRFGRYTGLQAYLYYDGVEKLIWTDSFTSIAEAQQRPLIVSNFIPFLSQALEITSVPPRQFSSLETQQNYLKARVLIDDYQSELKLKRAQVLLHSAIQSFPLSAKAHAALCESYLRDSWRSNEKESLESAQSACDTALSIAPNEPYALAMLGYLYHRTGRVDEAIMLLEQLVQAWPDNVDALSGLSYAYRAALLQELADYPNAKLEMLNNAKKIIELEPDFWAHHSTFGQQHYIAGNLHKAAQSFEIAAQLNPSQIAYVNVGTITMCLGDISKAKAFYLKAQQIAPSSYHGDDYLGSVAFYQQDFAKSSQLKQKALDSFNDNSTGGTHQMWGDLGDAYRRNVQTDESIVAYLRALKIIERDTLRGNLSTSDKIYQHYYSLMLTQLAPSQYSRQNLNLKLSQLIALADHDIQSTTYARLAYAFYLYHETDLAQQALDKAASRCSIYYQHPDLKQIIVDKGVSSN